MRVKPRAKTSAPASRPAPPGPEEIARRAYEIFLARGGAPGQEEGDWLRAERDLLDQWEKTERSRAEAPRRRPGRRPW